jgi:hypothetical protein
MHASQIPGNDLGKDGVVGVGRTHKWIHERVGKPGDHVLVIWTGRDWVGKIKEFRIIRRRIKITGRNSILIFRIQRIPCGNLNRPLFGWKQRVEDVP